MKNMWKKTVRNMVMIAFAAFIYAVGVSLFLDPNNLAPGGVTGIAVILNRLSGIETGTLYFLLNIPIVLLGIWKFGWRFIVKTAYAIVLTSTFTNLLSGREALTDDPLLAALAGGVLIASGIGMVFKTGATTGGMDIIIKIIRQKYRHLKTGYLFQCIDITIVAISGLLFRNLNIALYALIAVLISGRALDYVLYGKDEAKLQYIISDKADEITDRLLKELDIGVTQIEGRGAFSGKAKKVLMCVVKKPVSPQVEDIVREEDAEAFMVITSATEIFGEGYKSYFGDRF